MKNPQEAGITRIGVFYDGNYLAHVSNYYMYQHSRQARLSIAGLHEFLREEVAKAEQTQARMCHIVDAHYFRGRMTARRAADQGQDQLFKDRQWDDVLIREGVTMHFMPLTTNVAGEFEEKGVDVWFALEALELAIYKKFDVVVLVTGDGDFIPLVRKLNTLGTRVMLLAWDFEYTHENVRRSTRVSQNLINEVTYPLMMANEIDTRVGDKSIDGIFVQRIREDRENSCPEVAKPCCTETPVASVTEPELEDSPDVLFGSIITLQASKGYAFIRPDLGGDNVFFHGSSLRNKSIHDLGINTRVSYLAKQTDRGMVAEAVAVVEPEEA